MKEDVNDDEWDKNEEDYDHHDQSRTSDGSTKA